MIRSSLKWKKIKAPGEEIKMQERIEAMQETQKKMQELKTRGQKMIR